MNDQETRITNSLLPMHTVVMLYLVNNELQKKITLTAPSSSNVCGFSLQQCLVSNVVLLVLKLFYILK